MLAILRKNAKKWHWLLWAVIITMALGLIVVYGTIQTDPVQRSIIAKVDGIEITYPQYQQAINGLRNRFQQQFGENYQQFAANLDLEKMAFDNVKQTALLLAEAQRRGISVTSAEVRQDIFSQPYFQQNGVFNREQYVNVLGRLRRTAQEFEEQVREDLIVSKMRNLLMDTVVVSKDEVWQDWKNKNDKKAFDYVLVDPATYEPETQVTDEESLARYNQDPSKYVVPTRVKLKYFYIAGAEFKDSITPTEEEIQAYYEANKDTAYAQEEQVHARHILVKVDENGTPEQVRLAREKADGLREQLNGGADFAALATSNSDDVGSAAKGGDLGFFGRGRMVAPFENAAFTLAVGEVSEPIRSQFGFHLIKVEEKKDAGVKSLAEVQPQVVTALKEAKGKALAEQRDAQISSLLAKGGNLDQVAAETGWELKESGFFEKGGRPFTFPKPPEVDEWAFSAKKGDVSRPIPVFELGVLYAQVSDRIDEHQGSFEEVKDRVHEELLKEKTQAKAQARAEEIHAALKVAGADWTETMNTLGATAASTQEFKRTDFVQPLGSDEELKAKIFGMPVGTLGEVTQVNKKSFLVFKVTKDIPASQEEFEKDYAKLRTAMLQQKQSLYLSWALQKMEQAAEVNDYRKNYGIEQS